MATSPSTHFISCDWGTTNFRLRVIDRRSFQILAEVINGQGVRTIHQEFLQSGVRDRQAYYTNYLNQQLELFPETCRHLPVVASGMASSSVGLRELPYAELPVGADGGGLRCEWVPLGTDRRLLLISGVRSTDDIMRGEEVQAVGLARHLMKTGPGILILPGTHSKHLHFDGAAYTAFSTYMTGELFELLSTGSILASSIRAGDFSPECQSAFRGGVSVGGSSDLAGSLFGVRVRDVFRQASREENHYYLSGLLIGNELRGLAASTGKLYVAAAVPLLDLYWIALEELYGSKRIIHLDGAVLQEALHFGQSSILTTHGH